MLTLIAVAAAFALFGLLRTLDDAFAAVAHRIRAAHRLVTVASSRGRACRSDCAGKSCTCRVCSA